MNKLEQQLLDDVAGGKKPRLVVRTRTRIDVGRWWWPKRAWLCVIDQDLVMLAVSRRRYVVKKPLADCRESYYCHASGHLVIEPGEELTFKRFKLSPRQALNILAEIRNEFTVSASTD